MQKEQNVIDYYNQTLIKTYGNIRNNYDIRSFDYLGFDADITELLEQYCDAANDFLEYFNGKETKAYPIFFAAHNMIRLADNILELIYDTPEFEYEFGDWLKEVNTPALCNLYMNK